MGRPFQNMLPYEEVQNSAQEDTIIIATLQERNPTLP